MASWDCEPVVLAERGAEPERDAGPWPEQLTEEVRDVPSWDYEPRKGE